MVPPVRLVFALVVAAGGGDHRDGLLIGRALDEFVAGEPQQRACGLVLVDGVVSLFLRRRRIAVGDAVIGGAFQQPVAEFTGGPAVVVVVVFVTKPCGAGQQFVVRRDLRPSP